MSDQAKRLKISDLVPGTQNVDTLVNIVSLQRRELKNDRGESVYYYGILGDDTGTISFTAWIFPPTVRIGDVVEIRKASVREYKGINRVYIDAGSEIIMHPGESMDVKRSYSQMKIKDLSTAQPYVTVEGRLSGVREKELDRDGKKTMMYYGDLEDDTGKIRISSFEKALKEGTFVRMEGAKVSEYNGRLRITVGSRTEVTEIKPSFQIGERLYDIHDINSPLGGVTVNGFIVSLGPKSGLVMRCSVCNSRLDDIHCPDHPEASVVYDLFAYFTLDDGTGSIQCTGGKNALLGHIGFTPEQYTPENKTISRRLVASRLQEKLLGRAVVIEGDVTRNQSGTSVRISTLNYMDTDFMKKLEARMGADFQ
ncbi:MAG: OB-fold nucleic acid binding domain-containing protein [Thermoplasmataceae archaeon]